MSAIWEPWVPEVGQRVRVLARPECYYCRTDGAAEVGQTGVVTDIYSPGDGLEPGQAAHRYWIDFDDPTVAQRTVARCAFSHFAAIELEPLP